MKLPKDLKGISRGLDGILDRLDKLENTVKDGFEKIKNKIEEFPKYLDDISREIRDKTYYGFRRIKDGISEYKPIIIGSAIAASPLYVKASILAGLQIIKLYKGTKGKLLGYGLIIGGIVASGLGIILGLNAIHSLPSNNEHIQYVGSGYIEFVPNGQTISYDRHTDPVGYLILYSKSNDTTIEIPNVIWDGQYANTIIQNHNQIVQLNDQFVGQTDPINNQPYAPLQDVYVIDAINSKVPIQQVTIDGQTYYVIDANKINPADIAGFYTYQGWVTNFVEAMNTPGTYAAGIPGNSPVYDWANITGTVVYQTQLYEGHGVGGGSGDLLIEPNGIIISYGVIPSPSGSALFNFISPQQSYNPSS